MPTTDENKPAGKSGRRKGKGEQRKKAVSQQTVSQKSLPESPAPVQLQSPDQDQELQQPEPVHAESPTVDQQPAVEEPVVVVTASPEPQPIAAPPLSEPATAPPAEPVSVERASAEPASAEPSSAEPAPVSLQTIANAYRDYTRKSIEEFGSFVEQLSGVRSLDKAMTVQSEFVKRAYETSVAEFAEDLRTSQPACQANPRPVQGVDGQGAGNARQVLRFTQDRFDANEWNREAPVFPGAFFEGSRP